jgi:hypothetical protein
VSANWGNRIAEGSATYSQFEGNWSLQGQASGSVFAPVSAFVGEVAGFAGGSTHRDGSGTSELLLNARLHATHRLAEWFLGAGAGRTTFADESRTLLLAEAGVDRSIPQGNATFTLTPVAMGDSIRYADGQLAIAWQRGKYELGALAGARIGDQLTALGGTARAWANVSFTARLTSRAALLAGGGTYPIDPTQGFPGGRFISLGVRIAYPRRPTRVADSGSVDTLQRPKVAFEVERHSGQVAFKVLAPTAQSVELTGDFSDWDPVQLTPAGDGWWTLTRSLSPGNYQVNLRLNRGKWEVPPGLLIMADEFGGSVGLLVLK